METKVLEVAKHPEIHFLSNVATVRESSEGRWTLDVGGTLALHGVSQAVVVPLTVSMQSESLRLQGAARRSPERLRDRTDFRRHGSGHGEERSEDHVRSRRESTSRATPSEPARDRFDVVPAIK